MKCPRCRAESQAGVKFCEDCGARLALTCLSCGAEVLPHKKFCSSRGAVAGLDPSELGKAEQHYCDALTLADTRYAPASRSRQATSADGEREQAQEHLATATMMYRETDRTRPR